jgi:hypothetical protein
VPRADVRELRVLRLVFPEADVIVDMTLLPCEDDSVAPDVVESSIIMTA